MVHCSLLVVSSMGSLLSDHKSVPTPQHHLITVAYALLLLTAFSRWDMNAKVGFKQRHPTHSTAASITVSHHAHPRLPPLRAVHGLWNPTSLLGEFWRAQAMPWLCCPPLFKQGQQQSHGLWRIQKGITRRCPYLLPVLQVTAACYVPI